jgi:alpha-glucosidase (family GH31 glycosyl hydrolase)
MGWAGTQRYAVAWTGDQSSSWDYIRWHIPTLVGSGLSGQAYASGDVDAIFGGSAETYTRDLQWKSFTPVLMGMSGWSASRAQASRGGSRIPTAASTALPEAEDAPDALHVHAGA